MPNRIKSIIVGTILCFVLSSKSYASITTLWGTNHRTAFNDVDDCGRQNEYATSGETFINKSIQIPNFILATEKLGQDTNLSNGVQVDDPILHDYVSIFTIVSEFDQKVRTKIKNNQMSPATFLSLEKVFYILLGVNKSTSPYFRYNKKFMAQAAPVPIPRDSTTQESMKIFARDDNVDGIMKNYIDYAKNIATAYYNENIKPYPKYNIAFNTGNEKNEKHTMFEYANPENLFLQKNFARDAKGNYKDKTFDIVVGFWRDYFMADNLTKLIAKNPTANILAWVGDGHIPNIAWLLNSSRALSLTKKKSIGVISKSSDYDTACHYDKVLESFVGNNKSIPLSDWNRAYLGKIGFSQPTGDIIPQQ